MKRQRSRDVAPRGRKGPGRAARRRAALARSVPSHLYARSAGSARSSRSSGYRREAAIECPHRGTIRLTPRRPCWIGRSQGSDLVLPSTSVSRRHAAIEWRDGRYFVHDLLSQNGTYVNGRRVTCRPLRDGDLVRIGEFELRYRESGGYPHPEASPGGVASTVREGVGRSVLRGDLELIGLDVIVPLLELHGRDGVLEIPGDGGGRLYFSGGRLAEARSGRASGRDAFLRLFERRVGRFLFQQRDGRLAHGIRESATALILEGMRRRDERRRSRCPGRNPG